MWLALLTMNTFYDLNEILTMLVEDDLRKKMIKDVKMMSMEELVLNGMVLSEEERKTLDLIYKYDCEKYDREEGMEIATVNIIKSMIDNKLDYGLIEKTTKKTIEEIKEIERSMKKD